MSGGKTSMAGYTLLELLVVLAIIGMLTAIAIPRLSDAQPGLRVRAAARALSDDLNAARQKAIDEGVQERVVLDPAHGRYAILPAGVRRALSQGISIVYRGALPGEIDFYPDGSASGGSILVSGAHARHRVGVSWPSGLVRIDE